MPRICMNGYCVFCRRAADGYIVDIVTKSLNVKEKLVCQGCARTKRFLFVDGDGVVRANKQTQPAESLFLQQKD